MLGPISEVDYLFWVSSGPGDVLDRVCSNVDVALVGSHRRVAALESRGHPRIIERTGKTSVANAQKPVIPGFGRRQPDFKTDMGAWRRRQETYDTAKSSRNGHGTETTRHGQERTDWGG